MPWITMGPFFAMADALRRMQWIAAIVRAARRRKPCVDSRTADGVHAPELLAHGLVVEGRIVELHGQAEIAGGEVADGGKQAIGGHNGVMARVRQVDLG